MSLSVQSRRVGDVVILKCQGRIVLGAEADTLREQVDALLPDDPFIVLDVGDVDFLDSAGLGLLVRLVNKAQFAKGDLKLCAVPPKFKEVFRITKLGGMFDSHETEAEAIAAFYQRPKAGSTLERFRTDVLCVEQSPDVLAYVCEVLRQSGLGVLTADNLADALTLLRSTTPKVIVIGATLRAMRGSWSADQFQTLAAAVPMVELPADFSSQDAAEASRRLLDDVRSASGSGV